MVTKVFERRLILSTLDSPLLSETLAKVQVRVLRDDSQGSCIIMGLKQPVIQEGPVGLRMRWKAAIRRAGR